MSSKNSNQVAVNSNKNKNENKKLNYVSTPTNKNIIGYVPFNGTPKINEEYYFFENNKYIKGTLIEKRTDKYKNISADGYERILNVLIYTMKYSNSSKKLQIKEVEQYLYVPIYK